MHSMRDVSFSLIWGLTEDYDPGDSVSDGSEELLGRGRGEASVYVILEKGYMQSSTHLGGSLLLVKRNSYD